MPKNQEPLIGGVRINPVHAQCRVYGHAWTTVGVGLPPAWIEETMECDRCGTVRVDRIERVTGFVKGRKYKHAEGYIRKGETRIGKEELGKFRLYTINARETQR